MRAYLDDAVPLVLYGTIDPGRVFDRVMTLEETPTAYAAMDAREALKQNTAQNATSLAGIQAAEADLGSPDLGVYL